ncbi:ABC transporter permease [Eubacteriaceae bacterium ES3]|nr:ABC transporter permease [Eubacteriaceae bacterium ES3]
MNLLSFLTTVINTSTPILLAAMGILIMHLAGVINIGAEGMMLIGAFSGVVGSYLFGNVWLGMLFALGVSAVVGLLFAWLTVGIKANQVVVGIALNIIAEGLTTTLYRTLFGMKEGSMKVAGFTEIGGGFTLPVYLTILAVILLSLFLYKTRPGLRVRATGEYPAAIDSVGLSVEKIRYLSTIGGSMFIGAGGAYLSLGLLSFFTENMVSGRGFIALAAVIFGRYTPVGALLAVLLFGAGEAMQFRIQSFGSDIPTQLLLMIPYVLTIVMVSVFGQKSGDPSALGVPFTKGK